jgi:Lrp/AsnC family transcriptional regulator
MTHPPLDAADYKLLDALQRDASLSRKRLAEICHISEATCSRRMASLKKRGYLTRQVAILDPAKLGLKLTVFVLLEIANEQAAEMKRFIDRLKKTPELMTFSFISGEYDYLAHLVVRDMQAYYDYADEYFSHDPLIRKYTSLFEMKSLKHTNILPL